MMNKFIYCYLVIFLTCVACQHKQKMSREEENIYKFEDGTYPEDSIEVFAYGVNPYSLIIDYCELCPVDSTKITPLSLNHYCTWGINGKTLEEIEQIYGKPENAGNAYKHVFYSGMPADYPFNLYENCLRPIFQKIDFPVIFYIYAWTPNTDEKIDIYFIKDNGVLRAIYGIRYNLDELPD